MRLSQQSWIANMLKRLLIVSLCLTGWRVAQANDHHDAAPNSTILPTLALAAPTDTAAVVTWTTATASTSQIVYGPTTAYGSTTTFDPTLVTSHSQTIVGLIQNSAYHYAIMASAGGATQTGQDQIFYTGWTSWSIPGVSIDMDFADNHYLGGTVATLVSDSRAATETCNWADGHTSTAPPLTPCVTDLGMCLNSTADIIHPIGALATLLNSGAATVYSKIPGMSTVKNGAYGFILGDALGHYTFAYQNNVYAHTQLWSSNGSVNLAASDMGYTINDSYGDDGGIAILAWDGTGRSINWNNGYSTADTSGVPTPTQIGGTGGNNGALGVCFQRLAFFNYRIPDSQLPHLGRPNTERPNIAAGYNTLAFHDEFTSLSTIDVNASGKSGYNWYVQAWFGGANTPSTSYQLVDGTLVLSGQALESGYSLASTRSPYWVGNAFGGGVYVEARFKFDPALGGIYGNYWPAFWAEATQHVQNFADHDRAEHWPGQAARYDHYVEIDMEMCCGGSFVGKTSFNSGIVDWYGVWTPKGGYPNHIHNQYSLFFDPYKGSQATNWNQFHTYGYLIVPQNGTTPGHIQWFFDGLPGPAQFWQGPIPASPPLPGDGGNILEARTPSAATATYAITDIDTIMLNIATQVGWPITVNWVRVWCASSGCRTTQ
jgi:hypothetical protein